MIGRVRPWPGRNLAMIAKGIQPRRRVFGLASVQTASSPVRNGRLLAAGRRPRYGSDQATQRSILAAAATAQCFRRRADLGGDMNLRIRQSAEAVG